MAAVFWGHPGNAYSLLLHRRRSLKSPCGLDHIGTSFAQEPLLFPQDSTVISSGPTKGKSIFKCLYPGPGLSLQAQDMGEKEKKIRKRKKNLTQFLVLIKALQPNPIVRLSGLHFVLTLQSPWGKRGSCPLEVSMTHHRISSFSSCLWYVSYWNKWELFYLSTLLRGSCVIHLWTSGHVTLFTSQSQNIFILAFPIGPPTNSDYMM